MLTPEEEGKDPKGGLKLEDPNVFEQKDSRKTSERSPHYVGRELPKAFELGQDHHFGVGILSNSHRRLDVELESIPGLFTFFDTLIHSAALEGRIFPERVDQKLFGARDEYQAVC